MSDSLEAIRKFLLDGGASECMLTVEGRSMAPALLPGDEILVRRVAEETLRLGDVVVFYLDGWKLPCTHRLIWKRSRGGKTRYYTKGDALPHAECFEADAFVGRVERALRGGEAIRENPLAAKIRALLGCALYLLFKARRRLDR
ncbi:MAG: S24/S26 family peptidase [Acidobacteriota bacterium]|nr:MAG: S24/S26 family peptidase [Acidobacteriota bacterium]